MFFLYILKENGYPISDLFDKQIRDIDTMRFSKNFDDEYAKLNQELTRERKALRKGELRQSCCINVDKDALKFNDRVTLSDRVYKRWVNHNWDEDSMDSNHAPLLCDTSVAQRL